MGFGSRMSELQQEYEREHPLLAQIERYSDIPGKKILYDIDKTLAEEIEEDWGEVPVYFYLEINQKRNPDTILIQSQMYDSIDALFKEFVSAIDFIDSDKCNIWLMVYPEDGDMDRLASVNYNCYYTLYK